MKKKIAFLLCTRAHREDETERAMLSKTALKTAAGVARRTLATQTLGKGEITQVRTSSPASFSSSASLCRCGDHATTRRPAKCALAPFCGHATQRGAGARARRGRLFEERDAVWNCSVRSCGAPRCSAMPRARHQHRPSSPALLTPSTPTPTLHLNKIPSPTTPPSIASFVIRR